MRLAQFEDKTLHAAFPVTSRPEVGPLSTTDVFAELVDLLDDYAPAWYSQDQQERAHAALRLLTGR